MLSLNGNIRIFLYQSCVDLRKGFEALSCLVSSFNHPLTSGAYFVFLNRQKDKMKVLYWDSDGLVIWYKRLEQGRFKQQSDQKIEIDRREFLLMLEGITPKKLQKRFKLP